MGCDNDPLFMLEIHPQNLVSRGRVLGPVPSKASARGASRCPGQRSVKEKHPFCIQSAPQGSPWSPLSTARTLPQTSPTLTPQAPEVTCRRHHLSYPQGPPSPGSSAWGQLRWPRNTEDIPVALTLLKFSLFNSETLSRRSQTLDFFSVIVSTHVFLKFLCSPWSVSKAAVPEPEVQIGLEGIFSPVQLGRRHPGDLALCSERPASHRTMKHCSVLQGADI